MNQTIICYDICDPRRLNRIYRALCKRAWPIQYSVFLFTGDRRQLRACLQELQALMDPREDDIRAYPLPRRGLHWSLGQSLLPEGIYEPKRCARPGAATDAGADEAAAAAQDAAPAPWVIM